MNVSPVNGLVFDLDNTLLDRQAVFVKVAESFYDEHLRNTVSITREDAVAAMFLWDDDGYADREEMKRRWLSEWPGAGLDMKSLVEWYRSAMRRHVEPDLQVNGFLARLNDRHVPWGIVTNGSTNQRGKCRAAGLEQLAPFIIVSEEVGYRKPDLRIFRDALAATGLTAPEPGHVRRGQPGGRHRRGQALWNEGGLDQTGSAVSGRPPAPGPRRGPRDGST